MFTTDITTWLQGRRVVISGGSSGLGRAIAVHLASGGAEVWSIDQSGNPEIGPFETHGAGTVRTIPGDITDQADVRRFLDVVTKDGEPIDMLVNNAGIGGPYASVEDVDLDEFRRVLDVNVMGQVGLTQACIPFLRGVRGAAAGGTADPAGPASVVFISSAAGRLPYPMRSPYATSKWGVVGLAKTLAWELGPDGIRVNAVLPGIVDTPLARKVLADRSAALGMTADELWDRFLSRNALPTPVVVDDVVNAVVFLLSPLAGHISGQALSVCGGADSIAVMD